MTLCGLIYGLYVLYETLVLGTTVRGGNSLVCLQLLFNGATLMSVGLLGDYVARIYEEAKHRPLYVVSSAINVDPSTPPPRRGVWLH